MKRLIAMCLGLLISVNVMAASQYSAVQMLSGLLQRYNTFQANFKQITYASNGRATQMARGRIWLMRPGKFRWQTTKPNRQLIIADGTWLWNYDIDLQQATRQKINKNSSTDPAALLSGNVRDINRQFTVTLYKRSRHGIWFQLKPRNSKTSGFKVIRMRFYKQKLDEMLVINNIGQTSIFDFSKIKINPRLSPNLFVFRAPRGVTVLKR